MSINYKLVSLLGILIAITCIGMAKADVNQEIELSAKDFLQNAPHQNADALLKYLDMFREKYASVINQDESAPYCRALQLDHSKALDIMYVFFGGAADARLPWCRELQLDAKLPEVKKWIESLRKASPKVEGTIRNPLIRAAEFSLLVAAVSPERISDIELDAGKQYEKDTAKIPEILQLEKAAQKSVIAYYQENFSFDKNKATKLAKKHMTIIAWRNGKINF